MTDTLADFDGLTQAAAAENAAENAAEILLDQAAADVAEIQGAQTRSIYLAVRAGIRLLAAKAETAHGGFLPLLKTKGWKESTAKRYMRLAASMRDALALRPNELTLLLSAQPRLTEDGAVSIDARPTLSKKIAKWIDGRSLTEIMQDLGIRRELKSPDKDTKGDADDGAEDGETPPPTDLDNARSVWFGRGGKGGILTDLRIWGVQEKSFTHLPETERRQVLDLLTDLRASIEASFA